MAENTVDTEFYLRIRSILAAARAKAYNSINFAMVEAYWEIGKSIVEKQGGNPTAEYGTHLLQGLSIQLTEDFGKGFTVTNLKYMRQFYLTFPNHHTLCDQLSWSHYRLLMRVEDENARAFYMDECKKSQWSVRQLERQINTLSYQRLLMSHGDYGVVDDTTKREQEKTPADIIRDPYVLEFLGLEQRASFMNLILNRLS